MSLWAKCKIWAKVALFSAVTLYVLLFLLKNTGSDRQVPLWVWFYKTPTTPVLVLLPLTFLFGVVSTLLVRTIFRTVRQLNDMKRRKMEKEAAAIITRAAKLRVREQQEGRGFEVNDPGGPTA